MSALLMKLPGRTIVQARPEPIRCFSERACHFEKVIAGASAPMTDSFTTWRTPAFFAASTALISRSIPFTPAETRYSFSIPFNALATDSLESMSPSTISAFPSNSRAFCGLLTRSRGLWPLAISWRATSPPVVPVAPRTRIIPDAPFESVRDLIADDPRRKRPPRSAASLLESASADRPQRRGGGDRVLGDPDLDQRRPARGERAVERGSEFRGRLHQLSVRAEGAGVGREVRVDESRAMHAARVVALLVHADGAVLAVVDDDHHDGELVPHGGRELLARHEEAAVPSERDHDAVGMERLRRDGRGHAIPHRAAGGAQLGLESAILMEPVHPGGVVAGAVGDDGGGREPIPQGPHDLGELHRPGNRHRSGPGEVLRPGGGTLRSPDRRRLGLQPGERRGKLHHPGIDGQLRCVDPAELLRAAVCVEEPLPRHRNLEQRIPAGGDLTETGAEDEGDVGVADPLRELRVDTDPDVPGVERMAVVEGILEAEGAGHRQLPRFGEAAQIVAGLGGPSAAAHEDDGAARAGEDGPEPGHLLLRRGRRDPLRRGDGLRDRLLLEHVLRKREHHGPRPPRHRRVEGVAHIFRDAPRVVDLRHPLGELSEHPPEIDLLERLAIEEIATGLTDEEDDRRRILEGRVDAYRRMRGSGAPGDERNPRAARQLAVRVRHVGRARFVATDDEADLLALVVEAVEEREVALAGDAEDVVGTLDDEAPRQDLSARSRDGGHGAVVPRRRQPCWCLRTCWEQARAPAQARSVLFKEVARRGRRRWAPPRWSVSAARGPVWKRDTRAPRRPRAPRRRRARTS